MIADVIPALAVAKISARLGADQSPRILQLQISDASPTPVYPKADPLNFAHLQSWAAPRWSRPDNPYNRSSAEAINRQSCGKDTV